MLAFRIADVRHEIYSAVGAALRGGRWNSPGLGVIYAAETFAGAMLEVLVHANLSRIPASFRLVTVDIPDALAIETVAAADLPDWSGQDLAGTRAVGDRWIQERRTAILRVPSVVTGGRENNLVLNPAHADFVRLQASAPEPIYWDDRLLRR